MYKSKEEIINAIESHQWDYEKELVVDGVTQIKEENLIMRKVKGSNSIYSNKVVKSVFKNKVENNINYVFNFLGDKPFSWWISPNSKPFDLKEHLIKRGMEVIDEYIGLALDLNKWEKLEIELPYLITEARNEKDLREHVKVSEEIWGLDEESAKVALKQRVQYFNLPSRRGNFIVALDNASGVGNGSYRYSQDGEVIYLTGSAVLPKYRKQGIYSSMVAYRLNMAKDKGCRLATVQARKGTSEPILRKMGFKEYGKYYLMKKE
ncbi:GNAT family N-acetyltransferase [Dethiothermospora halolimnae]|uniref:GNAT family N-acetyltransferase n=1 Tax=Dethiothermospora halolimnae TaxID=3114390 RepID=UPI003CCC443B